MVLTNVSPNFLVNGVYDYLKNKRARGLAPLVSAGVPIRSLAKVLEENHAGASRHPSLV